VVTKSRSSVFSQHKALADEIKQKKRTLVLYWKLRC